MCKEPPVPNRNGDIDERLYQPFRLGWTREVVRRVMTKNPVCDVYYFTPTGKKLRSIREVTAHLTDGLTAECFSFKRELLGLGPNYETIRNAGTKQKRTELGTTEEPGPSGIQPKKIKCDAEESESSVQGDENHTTETSKNNQKESQTQNNPTENTATEEPSNPMPATRKEVKENPLADVPFSEIEKEIVRRVTSPEMRESVVLATSRILRECGGEIASMSNEVNNMTNKETETKRKKRNKTSPVRETERRSKRNRRLVKTKDVGKNARTEYKNKKGKGCGKKKGKLVAKSNSENQKKNKGEGNWEMAVPSTSGETDRKKRNIEPFMKKNEKSKENTVAGSESKEGEEDEADKEKESGDSDLISIVQKNIGKYRKLREKQQMGLVKQKIRRSGIVRTNNSRAELFLKNRKNYLKPLEKGWRRELVFRSNCSKAGLQADVYYFHPNGKKFRSSREISENRGMIGGLDLEYFTFRKEAVGCGEPQEVIRNARSPRKN